LDLHVAISRGMTLQSVSVESWKVRQYVVNRE
jgi:hypothetical protein